jgi:transposase
LRARRSTLLFEVSGRSQLCPILQNGCVNGFDLSHFRKLVARGDRAGLIVLPKFGRDLSLCLLMGVIAHLASFGVPSDVIVNHVLEVGEAGVFTCCRPNELEQLHHTAEHQPIRRARQPDRIYGRDAIKKSLHRLHRIGLDEAGVRLRQVEAEHMQLYPHAADDADAFAKIDLRMTRRMREHQTSSNMMGWNGPIDPQRLRTTWPLKVIRIKGDHSMDIIATIGLDLAKSVFQIHAIDSSGDVIVRRALRRAQLLDFFRKLSPCLVGMEACASAHFWARHIRACGHDVRIIPPIYVKAYVKRSKTDAADAEAICEAVTRPTMRFVPIKTPEQQAAGMVLKTRDLLVRQRSQTANAFRAHMSELGVVAAAGMASLAKLAEAIRDPEYRDIPEVARQALLEMVEQIDTLSVRIERLDRDILTCVKEDETARRLTTIPGVGPIIAATVRAAVHDAHGFRTGRDFAAWTGLVPRAHSSGGKERLGSISKRGNRQLRTLLIVGATSIIKLGKRGVKLPQWLTGLILRKPYKLVAVALANKMARIIWVLLTKGGVYKKSPVAIAA